MSLFDVTPPVYVLPGGVTPSQPTTGGSLTPNYIQPDGSVIPSQPAASWWQRTFGGDTPAYLPAPVPPSPSERRPCNDDDGGGVILKGQGAAPRRRARAATETPSPFGTTPTE